MKLLDQLPGGERERLLGAAARVRVPPGAALLREGETDSHVLVLLTGRVKVVRHGQDGRELLLEVREPGDLIGEMAALDGGPRSSSVVAIEEVEALTIPRGDFLDLLRRQPGTALALAQLLAQRLRDADNVRLELAHSDVLTRVAARIVLLTEWAENGSVGLSQQELADWAGASIESTSRALQTLRELGLIETGRRRIRVLDQKRLREYALR
jgi:CRP-like cAMP-binding protein